jgi:hypothetical protein
MTFTRWLQIRSFGNNIRLRTVTRKRSSKGFSREALESGGTLIAIDSKSGQAIGSSRFHGYDKGKDEIEIGWTFLAPPRQFCIPNHNINCVLAPILFR